MSTTRGWAWGTTGAGEWLTIPGSFHYSPLLAETPEQAKPYPENIVGPTPVLALVERCPSWWGTGPAFRIIELAEEAK